MTAKTPKDPEPSGWGPVSRYVAANVARLRKERGLSTTRLSAALEELGQPIPATGITRIEKGQRRVDADDLTALALVFNVGPHTLLLPDSAGSEKIDLTRNYKVAARIAWQWAQGQRTAMDYEPRPIANPVGGDPSVPLEKFEREQEFERQQSAYVALTRPPELRRGAEHQAVRLGRDLADAIEDIVMPEAGVDRRVLEARGRMAKRRYAQLGYELEEIVERLPPAHPGVPLPDPTEGGQDE